MELTREDSIRIAIELWTWVAETGAMKQDWPGWEEYGEMSNWCPFCEFGVQQVNLREGEDVCEVCPYYQKFGGCCGEVSPYEQWCRAKTKKANKKYAALFLEQLKQL